MASHFLEQRKFLIRPRFQLVLAGKAVGLFFLYGALFVYASLQSVTETIYILPFNCLTADVKARLWTFPAQAILLSVLIALVVFLQAILISHRVTGPEFRLARILHEMIAGRYPGVVKLRKRDNLRELATEISLLGQSLDQRRQACFEQLDQVQRELEACSTDLRSHAGSEGVQSRLEGVRTRISALREFIAGSP